MPDPLASKPNDAAPVLPLDWGHDVADIPPGGLDVKRAANEAERRALVDALGVLGCEALHVMYQVKRAPAEGYRMTGKITADVVQACVVTLAPVHETVVARMDVEFRPKDDISADLGGVVDLDDAPDLEPIDHTWLPVGRIVFEETAAALNPYPRRPGAEFSPPPGADTAAEPTANPFAVLAKLKPSSPDNT